MPKSQIIKDIVEDAVPIDKSLTRLMVLARDVKNNKLETWARNELNGYSDIENLPDYRRIHSDLIKYNGINGGFNVNNAPLTAGWIDEEYLDSICEVNIIYSIKSIIDLSNSENEITRDLTMLAGEVYKKSGGHISCVSISQVIPKPALITILVQVKNMMITALCELEERYGDLDDLGIDISKKNSYQIETINENLNRAVFNIAIPQTEGLSKEPWYSKIGWNIIIPIITAIIAAVTAVIIQRYFGF